MDAAVRQCGKANRQNRAGSRGCAEISVQVTVVDRGSCHGRAGADPRPRGRGSKGESIGRRHPRPELASLVGQEKDIGLDYVLRCIMHLATIIIVARNCETCTSTSPWTRRNQTRFKKHVTASGGRRAGRPRGSPAWPRLTLKETHSLISRSGECD